MTFKIITTKAADVADGQDIREQHEWSVQSYLNQVPATSATFQTVMHEADAEIVEINTFITHAP